MTRSDFWASTAISTLMFGVGGFNPAIAQTTPSVATTQTTSAATATAADSSNGDVLVTARRREERLIDVPISIQTLSATQLAANRITDLQTLQTAAGFTFNSQGSSFFGGGREFPSLVFRGMSSNYGAGRADSGALFIDGIYISGGSASITLADASRVEVLKGPQNVYFGKNTFWRRRQSRHGQTVGRFPWQRQCRLFRQGLLRRCRLGRGRYHSRLFDRPRDR